MPFEKERKKETFYLLFIFIIYIYKALIMRVNFEHY